MNSDSVREAPHPVGSGDFYSDRLTPREIGRFQEHIYAFFRLHCRDLPWRNTSNPYHIVVSEIMLQQTQVDRVIQKFGYFTVAFGSFEALARAPLKEILALWQGLGYNRRALYLKKIAEIVVSRHNGVLPADPGLLRTWPGIGSATAASICTFAFNMPLVFIETNIRSLFIHLFFSGQDVVSDRLILPLVEKTLDRSNPRLWYSALMDYGTFLKKHLPNPARRSSHYRKQAPFEGSARKVRGAIIRALSGQDTSSFSELLRQTGADAESLQANLKGLIGEDLVKERRGRYSIK